MKTLEDGQIFALGVSKQDIITGECGDASRCMLANAFKRHGFNATVGITTFSLRDGNDVRVKQFYLPKRLERAVCDFDDTKNVKPFTIRWKLKATGNLP